MTHATLAIFEVPSSLPSLLWWCLRRRVVVACLACLRLLVEEVPKVSLGVVLPAWHFASLVLAPFVAINLYIRMCPKLGLIGVFFDYNINKMTTSKSVHPNTSIIK